MKINKFVVALIIAISILIIGVVIIDCTEMLATGTAFTVIGATGSIVCGIMATMPYDD